MITLLKLLVLLSGVFFAVEGASNLIYWRDKPTRQLFQLGRLVRTVLGVLVILLSLFGGA